MTTVNAEALSKFTGRYSKFKNIFGQTSSKELQITNLGVNQSAAAAESKVIAANDRYFAVPWKIGGGGAFNVVRHNIDDLKESSKISEKIKPLLNMERRIPINPPVMTGHSTNVLDLAFSPFFGVDTDDVLATGSGDGTIRIWQIPATPTLPPNAETQKSVKVNLLPFISDVKDSKLTLKGHEKKVHLVQFHPFVADVLCSSGLDQTVRLWDVAKGEEKQMLAGHTNVVQSLDWSNDGAHIVTSCKDKVVRLYDARKNTVVVSGEAHDGAKGFRVAWLGNKDQFITVGFNRNNDRELKLWDLRKGMKRGAMSSVIIDQGVQQLIPFVDSGNSLIYLAGKGDVNIRVYELDENEAPYIHFLNEYKAERPQSGINMLPKRLCDVKKYEVAKFIKLCGDSYVEFVSFFVPRKNSTPKTTGKELFQEDIFPPTLARQASLGAEDWFIGKDASPVLESLKPRDMLSVYEVSEQEGGKKRSQTRIEKQMQQFSGSNHSGFLQMLKDDAWTKRYFAVMKDSIVYGKEQSLLKKKKIPFTDILSVKVTDAQPINERETSLKGCWFQMNTMGHVYHLMAANPMDCVKWIECIKNASKKGDEKGFMEDHLLEISTSNIGVVQGLKKRWVCVWKSNILIFAQQRSSKPLKTIAIEKDLHSVETNINLVGLSGEEKRLCIKLETKSREKIYLMANSENQKDSWVEYIQQIQLDLSLSSSASGLTPEMKLLIEMGLARRVEAAAVGKKEKEPPGKIKVFPIPETLGSEDIKGLFSVFGDIIDFDLKREGKFKNTAFLTYKTKSDAESALKLDGANLDGETFQVHLLDLTEALEPATVRVDNIHPEIETHDFRSIFTAFGEVDMIKLLPMEKGEGFYGFVKFVDAKDANEAVLLNGSKMMGKEIGVKLVTDMAEEKMFANVLDPVEVKNAKQQVLIQIKGGKSNIRSSMVEFTPASLNSGDVFVLDGGKSIFQWNGKDATRFEKARGLDVASNLRVKERQGNAKVYVLDEAEEENNQKELDLKKQWENFWQTLCKSTSPAAIAEGKKKVLSAEKGGDDTTWPKKLDEKTYLYRISVSPTGGASRGYTLIKPFQGLAVKCVWSKSQPSKTLLKSENVYVLDCFTEVFIWEGNNVRNEQKMFAKQFAMKLIQQDLRPVWATMTRILESGETVLFKEKFYDYGGMLPIAVSAADLVTEKGSASASRPQPSAAELTKAMISANPPPEEMFDDADCNGVKTIWRVEGFDKIPVEETLHGHLFSGDSYVIRYTYKKKSKELNMVYFWQGRDSSTSEKGASALLTIDVTKETGGDALQIRVLQQKEGKHFLSIHPKGLIIHHGKLVDRVKAGLTGPTAKKVYLYDVRMATDESGVNRMRAVEVPDPSAMNLNSNHVSIVFSSAAKKTIYIWIGRQHRKEELQFAKYASEKLIEMNNITNPTKIDVVEVKEGDEKEEFFKCFGLSSLQVQQYKTNFKQLASNLPGAPPRFFVFSIATGVVLVDRIFNFNQDDIENTNIILVDTKLRVYVWFGSQPSTNEQKIALETAIEYVKQDSKGRPSNPESTIYITSATEEPLEFKNIFQAFGDYKHKPLIELAKEKRTSGASSASPTPTSAPTSPASTTTISPLKPSALKPAATPTSTATSSVVLLPISEKMKEYQRKIYRYQDLISDNYGQTVDKSKLETYLSDEEFERVFKLTREEFYKIPEWKQQKMKQEVYLF